MPVTRPGGLGCQPGTASGRRRIGLGAPGPGRACHPAFDSAESLAGCGRRPCPAEPRSLGAWPGAPCPGRYGAGPCPGPLELVAPMMVHWQSVPGRAVAARWCHGGHGPTAAPGPGALSIDGPRWRNQELESATVAVGPIATGRDRHRATLTIKVALSDSPADVLPA